MSILYKNEKSEKPGATAKVFIAIPTYGDIKACCVSSLWAAQTAIQAANIAADFFILSGNCHVDDARNLCVREFLEGDCEQLVFIDSDVGFDAVDLIKLIRHDRDVVGGTYPLKQKNEEFPVRLIGEKAIGTPDGLLEANGIPTGFMKIKRHVLEKLAEKAQKHNSRKDDPGRTKIPIIFERLFRNETRWSGDYGFCLKWREMGGQIFVDPEFTFDHAGESVWHGRLASFLRRKNGIAVATLLEAIKTKSETYALIADALQEWGNIPYSGDADVYATIIQMAREANGPILESGTGLSTLLMATANPNHLVTSYDNDIEWYQRTKTLLEGFGVTNVDLKCAPLKDHGTFAWYDADLGDSRYAMFFCDGPPRYNKGQRMGSQLWIPRAEKVVFHDADDAYVKAILDRWCSPYQIVGYHKSTGVGVVKQQQKALAQ